MSSSKVPTGKHISDAYVCMCVCATNMAMATDTAIDMANGNGQWPMAQWPMANGPMALGTGHWPLTLPQTWQWQSYTYRTAQLTLSLSVGFVVS